MKCLVTGGSGFIGSNLVLHLINNQKYKVLNIDKLTYASNNFFLNSINNNSLYNHKKIDICETKKIFNILADFMPDVILHLAAESHVDRSIEKPGEFIKTNIIGTFSLLEASLKYYSTLKSRKKSNFLFIHVSTDEVFGSLKNLSSPSFTENSSYNPNSPYSASKASSDHLVRSWTETFNLPSIITNCSNNFGPYQLPEKLIPLVISKALNGEKIPVFGNGKQIRDWLFVLDHVKALSKLITNGKIGSTYNIGGNNELRNIDLIKKICSKLDKLIKNKPNDISKFSQLIQHVDDRPGHDFRYAINSNKIKNELGWKAEANLSEALDITIKWYLENRTWYKKNISKITKRRGLRKSK